jgi:hypothetical protein
VSFKRLAWCVWQADNLFIYEVFARRMEGFPFPPQAEGEDDDEVTP